MSRKESSKPTDQLPVSDRIKKYLGEAKLKGKNTSDENFWKAQCRVHFHDDYKEKVLNKENSSFGWYTTFQTAFDHESENKSDGMEKLYSLIREWNLDGLKTSGVYLHQLTLLLAWLKKEVKTNRFCDEKHNFQDLLNCFFSIVKEKNLLKNSGQTLFHWAIFCNQSNDVIEKLIQQYKDIDKADGQGQTPLHYAVEYNHINAIHLFLNAGANVNAVNKKTRLTPLALATKLKNSTAISMLSRAHSQNNSLGAVNNAVPTPLQIAVQGGDIQIVGNLVARGENVSQFFDKKGNFIPTKESHPTDPRIEKFLKFNNAKKRLLKYLEEADKRDDDDRHWSVKIWGFTFFGGFGCTALEKKRAAIALKDIFIDSKPVDLSNYKKAINNGRLGSIYKALMETAPCPPSFPSSSVVRSRRT
jgi:Ankyrin repeats (3 copies)